MSESNDAERPRRKSPWRWLRRLVVVLVAFPLCAIVGALVLRWYFDDARLRSLAESQASGILGTSVTIAKLELHVGSDITIDGLVIGPPAGFSRDVLRVEHAHISWQLRPLLSKAIVIPDLSAHGITAVLEENPSGTNIDALMRNMSPPEPATAPAREPPAAADEKPLEQPDLPLRIDMQHIAFTDVRADVVKPDMTAFIDAMGMTGKFEAQGRAMSLDMWAGVGDREGEGRSHAHFEQPGTSLTSSQRGGLAVRSSGFGDVALELDFDATTDVAQPYALPTLQTAASARAKVNLLAQTAALESATFQLGKRTKAKLALRATSIMSTPTVTVETLQGGADLGELSPLVAAVMPGTRMRGQVELSAQPLTMQVAQDPLTLTSAFAAKADNVDVTAMGYDVVDLDATTTLGLASGVAAMHAEASIGEARAPQGTARGMHAVLEATTPVKPWLDTAEDGQLTLAFDASVARGEAPGAAADNTTMHVRLDGPIAILKGGSSTTPLRTHATLAVATAAAQGNLARGISVSADVSQRDLMANVVDATLEASVDNTSSTLPQGTVTLPKLTFATRVRRNYQSIAVPRLEMTLGTLMRMKGSTTVDAALGPAPRIKSFVLDVEPTDLAALLGLLPASMKPPARITGSMRAHASASGTVPYVELTRAAQAPAIPRGGDVWGATIAAYARFAADWAKRLDKGLPFTGEMTFDVDDFAYSDASANCDGGHFGAVATLGTHGPSMRAVLEVANVTKPQVVRDTRWEWTADLNGGHVSTRALGVVTYVEQPGLPRPIENTAFEMSAHYDLGGAAVLDRFAVVVPGFGTRFEARAQIENPIEVAIARSWEQPGLPGVAVDSAFELRVASREPMMLATDGPAVSGELASRGSFVLHDGAAVLNGDMRMHELSAKVGENELEGMSGTLPFDIRLAFDDRPGTTPLARDLSFGSVSLITGETGVTMAARPAYYDRLQDYHQHRGISARRIRSGPYVVENLVLDGGMANGRLSADTMRMHLLGGDVVGNMDFRLGNDKSISGDMDMKVSNIDASYFSMLNLKPGEESEMNADAHMTFAFAPRRRDFAFNMNVTKIGSKTLDRFLQLLDPEEKNDSLQRTRGQLKFVRIDNVAMWVRYENLNMDIDVTTFLRIPFTNIGFPNIERELLRRYSISEQLDFYLQPTIDKTVAPLLGWNAK